MNIIVIWLERIGESATTWQKDKCVNNIEISCQSLESLSVLLPSKISTGNVKQEKAGPFLILPLNFIKED